MAKEEAVAVRAARVTRRGVIVAATITAAAAIGIGLWPKSGSQNITASSIQAPVVQAGPGAHVTVGAAPKVRDVVSDGSGPIRVTTYIANAEPYPDGASIAGITWRDPFVDVRLDLLNVSDRIVEEVNLILQLDTSIAGVAQLVNDVPGLVATAEGDMPSLTITGTDEAGREITIPVIPAKSPDAQLAPAYRITIPSLPAKMAAHLLIASVAVNQPGPGCSMPEHLFAARRPPVGGMVVGSYTVRDPNDPQRVRVTAPLHFQTT